MTITYRYVTVRWYYARSYNRDCGGGVVVPGFGNTVLGRREGGINKGVRGVHRAQVLWLRRKVGRELDLVFPSEIICRM